MTQMAKSSGVIGAGLAARVVLPVLDVLAGTVVRNGPAALGGYDPRRSGEIRVAA
jgi:hypothetical protein